MNPISTPTGYVPVVLHLPEELARKFQTTNYNWEPLVGLLIEKVSPSTLHDRLLDLYFDFTRMMLVAPDETFCKASTLCENLYHWQQLCLAVHYLDNPVDHGAGTNHSE